jgi:hypothetical protein
MLQNEEFKKSTKSLHCSNTVASLLYKDGFEPKNSKSLKKLRGLRDMIAS